jgi:hypothetical protein
MLFTGLGSARLILILIWALSIGSVVANAFELPAPWRLGRFERPVMYGTFFLGGGAFWILALTSGSVFGLAALFVSLVAVPFAGLLIGRALDRRRTPDRLPPEAAPSPAGEPRQPSHSEPPRAA